VDVGDVIFGVAAGGQAKLMLVYEADERKILARHVTTQAKVEFARDGQSRWCDGGGSCTIVSTAVLPAEKRDVVIGLDRKMRAGREHPDFVLSSAERQLLLSIDEFFRSRPLPEL
jgi:hypothetical protein